MRVLLQLQFGLSVSSARSPPTPRLVLSKIAELALQDDIEVRVQTRKRLLLELRKLLVFFG